MAFMSWQWIAGFFEGEGYVGWQKSKKDGSVSGQGPRILIGQVKKEPLEAIREFLLEEGFLNPILYLRTATKGTPYKRKDIWVLSLNRRDDAKRFLATLLPYVFQKREAAEMVIRNIDAMEEAAAINVKQALELRATGLAWCEVARAMGVRYTRMRNTLVAHGIKVGREFTKAETDLRSYHRRKIICQRAKRKDGAMRPGAATSAAKATTAVSAAFRRNDAPPENPASRNGWAVVG